MISEGLYTPQNPPGFKQFCQTTNLIRDFEKTVEETHMKWLDEILVEAKRCFGKENHHLLPKTNADKKRKRARRKKSSLSEDGETSSTSQDSLESKEATRAPAKRHKAHERVEDLASQDNADSTFSSENISDAAIPTAIPPGETIVKAMEVPQEGEAPIAQTAASRTESQSAPVQRVPVEEEKAPPVRRSTRRAAVATGAATTVRRSTRTRSRTRKGQQQSESDSAGEEASNDTRPEAQGSKSDKTVAQRPSPIVESETELMSGTESPSLKDPPPRNSPAATIKSYYKDRVKRLINHHENMMSSADEFTPPKRPRVLKAAVTAVKTPTAPGTAARATRSRIKKPIRGGGGKDKPKEEENVPKPPAPKKNRKSSDADAVAVQGGAAKRESMDDFKQPQPITRRSSRSRNSVDGGTKSDGGVSGIEGDLKVVVVGVKSQNMDDPVRQNIVEEGDVGRAVAVETCKGGGRGSSVGRGPEKAGSLTSKDSSRKKSRGSSVHQLESSDQDDQAPAKESAEERESSEEGDDDVVPPSPKSVTAEPDNSTGTDASFVSASSSVPSEGRQPPVGGLRRSARVSISKRRSSNYHRFLGRASTASRASRKVSQMVVPIVEDEGRRTTRSRAKKLSQESTGSRPSLEAPPSLKRKSQDSDDGAGSSHAVASNRDESGESLSPAKSGTPDEDRQMTPPMYGDRATAPHPKSLLNPAYRSSRAKMSLGKTNGGGQNSSFMRRNTPLKKSLKERKQEILDKQRREDEIKKKLEDDKKQKMQEIKLKREQRARKVAEAKARRIHLQSIKKKALEERQTHKQAMSAKQREEKRREEIEKRLRLTKKKVELEERRRQEEEARLKKIRDQEELKRRQEEFIQRKKEYEEQERVRKAEEARRLAEQRRLEAERLKEEAERKRIEQEEAHEREMQLRKEEREREQKDLERKRLLEAEQRERERRDREAAEADRMQAAQRALRDKERQEEQKHLNDMMKKERLDAAERAKREKAEQDRLKASILKHNTSQNKPTAALNSTITKKKEPSPQSYEMTPQRIYVAASDENYGIEDLHSGDSTDDEDNPRKTIPKWAQGAALRAICLKQYMMAPAFEAACPRIDPPNLEELFPKKRARFFKRTSSAVWNSPPNLHVR